MFWYFSTCLHCWITFTFSLDFNLNSWPALSQWCILHRKKANHIVETWEKYFNNSPNERRIPFLYLANDILQNSRRKGSEFVNEFWKVLARAMKSVYANGNSHGKHEVIRLVSLTSFFTSEACFLCYYVWKNLAESAWIFQCHFSEDASYFFIAFSSNITHIYHACWRLIFINGCIFCWF